MRSSGELAGVDGEEVAALAGGLAQQAVGEEGAEDALELAAA